MLPPDALRSLYDAVRATGAEVARGLLQRLDDGVCRPWNGEIAGVVRAEASSLPEVRGRREARVGSLLELPELWIPWFHYCCLISTELLRRRGIRYPSPPSGENPAVLAGEDPPFLAEVLSSARRICVVPQPTYTYRVWAHRPIGFAQIRDELASAEAVQADLRVTLCGVLGDLRAVYRAQPPNADATGSVGRGTTELVPASPRPPARRTRSVSGRTRGPTKGPGA